MADQETKIVKTVCLACPPGCGIDVHVKDNKPVKVEGMPESMVGPICVKAEAIPQWYETELKKTRLLHPMKKDGVGWKQITWDEALDMIVENFNKIKDKYCPEALGYYLGQINANRDWDFIAKLTWECLGSPTFFSVWSICWPNRLASCSMTYGNYCVPSIARSKCIVNWGAGTDSIPFVSDGMIAAKVKKGAKLLVVDPRRTLLAKSADVHAAVLPGTDPAFGLGLLNVIITEELYDKEFVEKWTVGFDQLAAHIKDYSPEKVSKITTVPAEDIRKFARIYATTKPASLFWGNTLDCVGNGFQAHRAIQCLMSITGSLDVSGASRQIPLGCFSKVPIGENYPMEMTALTPEGKKWHELKGAGQDEHPIWCDISAESPTSSVFDAMLTGKPYPVKGLLIEAGNPVVTWANTNRQRKALSNLDFLVVYDNRWTETSEYADLVLPGPTFLEQQAVYQYVGRSMCILQNEVIKPPEDVWPDMKFWLELVKRFGFKDRIPWNTPTEVQEHLLGQRGVTMDNLIKNPGGYIYSRDGVESKKYEKRGFNTPSGKVELYSERLEGYGIDPLPTYHPLLDSPEVNPELARTYPLNLITGRRVLEYNHSMFHITPMLRERHPDPLAEIHTKTAKNLGISDGDPVIVETPMGSCEAKAKVHDGIHDQVISLDHAWGRMANGNLVTSDEIDRRDPATGVPATRGLACRIYKAEEIG